MRNEGACAAGLQKCINLKYDPHSSLTLSRTCEACAVAEVHVLHSFGECQLVDSACGWECKVREKDKVRNEEACVAVRQKLFNKLRSGNRLTLTHPLTVSRTCEARALVEVHGLHAHGKLQLGDIPCEIEHREAR